MFLLSVLKDCEAVFGVETFVGWAFENNRRYILGNDEKETFKRFKIWSKNFTKERFSFMKFSSNRYADLTKGEFDRMIKFLKKAKRTSAKVFSSLDNFKKFSQVEIPSKRAVSLPVSFNAVETGLVPPVKDQGDCGCCWAFAAASLIEHAVAKKTAKFVNVSVQHILDCSTKIFGCHGCSHGSEGGALLQINRHGACHEKFYRKYKGKKNLDCGPCQDYVLRPDVDLVELKMLGFKSDYPSIYDLLIESTESEDEEDDEDDFFGLSGEDFEDYDDENFVNYRKKHSEEERILLFKKSLLKYGLLSVSVTSSPWQDYTGGIFTSPCSGVALDHVALLVGWGTDYTKCKQGAKARKCKVEFWIIQNSWGDDWGENGYIRISMRVLHRPDYLGFGLCGVLNPLNYAVSFNFGLIDNSDAVEEIL